MQYTVEFLPRFAQEFGNFPEEHQNKVLDFIRTFQSHGRYKTSDMVLHFQWKNKGNHISLVDMYDHYTSEGRFYLPSGHYLDR